MYRSILKHNNIKVILFLAKVCAVVANVLGLSKGKRLKLADWNNGSCNFLTTIFALIMNTLSFSKILYVFVYIIFFKNLKILYIS